jgi:preprotein translocase subunit SecB
MSAKSPLEFISFHVYKVVFDRPMGVNIDGEFEISVQHIVKIHEDNKNDFVNEMLVNVKHKVHPFSLQVLAWGLFKINEEVPPPVYANFINVSSPAIMFPYMRAFVTNLFLQAGMTPLVISPINFAQIASDKAKQPPSAEETKEKPLS